MPVAKMVSRLDQQPTLDSEGDAQPASAGWPPEQLEQLRLGFRAMDPATFNMLSLTAADPQVRQTVLKESAFRASLAKAGLKYDGTALEDEGGDA